MSTDRLSSEGEDGSPLLLDRLLPSADAATVVTVLVEAPPDMTYAALKRVDFARMPENDPLMRMLVGARSLPDRISRRLRGQAPEVAIAEAGGRLSEMSDGPDAWIRLGETPGAEFAFGAIGRFLGAQVNWRRTTAQEFVAFAEPGYVKVAASLSVQPYGQDRSLLIYDCRAAATDESSRSAFLRYWRLLSVGIRLVLWRAAVAIGREAARTRRQPH
jgi:hypothetical protein